MIWSNFKYSNYLFVYCCKSFLKPIVYCFIIHFGDKGLRVWMISCPNYFLILFPSIFLWRSSKLQIFWTIMIWTPSSSSPLLTDFLSQQLFICVHRSQFQALQLNILYFGTAKKRIIEKNVYTVCTRDLNKFNLALVVCMMFPYLEEEFFRPVRFGSFYLGLKK